MKNLILVLFGVLAGLIASEVALRSLGVHGAWFSMLDPVLGWTLRPDVEGWHVKEGRALIHINSHGMRDRSRQVTKPENTFRVALLGDSFVEALQMPLEETLGAQLEKKLASCAAFGQKQIEVLNFGVSGYGTVQELLQLKHRVSNFHPDLVIVGFDTVNDVRDNFKTLSTQKIRPFLDKNQGAWHFDRSFRNEDFFLSRTSWYWESYYWLLSHSRIMQLVKRSLLMLKNRGNSESGVNDSDGKKESIKENINYLSYLPPDNEVWSSAWEHTEQAVEMLAEEAKLINTKFILVVLGTGIQIHPNGEYRQKRADEYGVDDWLYPDRRLADLGKKTGIEVFSLTLPMMKIAEESAIPLHFLSDLTETWGHWNPKGHEAAATILGNYLCDSQ